jgi:hypothetical protein
MLFFKTSLGFLVFNGLNVEECIRILNYMSNPLFVENSDVLIRQVHTYRQAYEEILNGACKEENLSAVQNTKVAYLRELMEPISKNRFTWVFEVKQIMGKPIAKTPNMGCPSYHQLINVLNLNTLQELVEFNKLYSANNIYTISDTVLQQGGKLISIDNYTLSPKELAEYIRFLKEVIELELEVTNNSSDLGRKSPKLLLLEALFNNIDVAVDQEALGVEVLQQDDLMQKRRALCIVASFVLISGLVYYHKEIEVCSALV